MTLFTHDLLHYVPTQRASLAPLFPQPHGRFIHMQTSMVKKTSPRSCLSKPKQRGFKTPAGGRARAASFSPHQSISLGRITTLTPLSCFIYRLNQEITFTRSVKIMSRYSFITASVFYFALFYHKGFGRD